jgi:hypothetical protein
MCLMTRSIFLSLNHILPIQTHHLVGLSTIVTSDLDLAPQIMDPPTHHLRR